MMITLNIQRSKVGNEIWETFTVFPKTSFARDPHRALFFMIWFARNKCSLANKLQLKKIIYNKENTIYVYPFTNIDTLQTEQIKLQYSPILGEKKCRVCRYESEDQKFCLMRGKRLKKNSHYKCLYWSEKLMTQKGRQHALHHCRRSKEDRRINQ